MTVPAIMTIREVAEALRCSKSHVYKMIQYGKLPGYTVAGKQVCKADDVTALCPSPSAVHDGISKGARDMTDIVERLLNWLNQSQKEQHETAIEAAKEIKRLRKALGDILDGLHGLDPQWEKIERAGRIAKEALKS